MMRVHRLLRTGLVALGVLAGLSFAVSPALAGVGHGLLTGQFGTEGSGDGQFDFPSGVAVDNDPKSPSQGDVYVGDGENKRVEWFDSAGKYEGQFNGGATFEVKGKVETGTPAPGGPFSRPSGVAVDPTSGDVWVADEQGGVVDKFDAEGKYAGVQLTGLGGVFGVAVDPSSGDVYVAVAGLDVVDKFTSAGAYVSQFKTEAGGWGVAVDSEGNVYVSEEGSGATGYIGQVQEFSSAGVSKAKLSSGSGQDFAVALDRSNGDVYVTNRYGAGPVQVFHEGALIYAFGSGGRGNAMAVSLNDTIYITGGGGVSVYAAGPTANKPVTLAAKEVKATSALLEGELLGGESGYYFAYSTNGRCEGAGKTGPVLVSGTPPLTESTLAKGLEPITEYTFCIAAESEYGPEFGPPLKVTTAASPPVVEKVAVSHIGPFEATLEAKVSPENEDTTCVFEYAKKGGPYGLPVACEPKEDLGEAFEFQPVSLHLEHLEGGTTYDFRVLAENKKSKEEGKPAEGTGEFTTPAALVPVIEAEAVSVETGKEAEPRAVTFAAQVNPELQETTSCVFEYVTEETFKKTGFTGTPPSAPCKPFHFGKNVNTGMGVSAEVTGLQGGVDYHYCVVAEDLTGASKCEDQRFGPPIAVTGAVLSEVLGVAPGTTATVGGEVNPEELKTSYYVEYGETKTYGQSSPSSWPSAIEEVNGRRPVPAGLDAGSGSASVAVDVPLESLAAGTLYHYRLVAYNKDGTVYGADMTVTVLPAPEVGPASVSEVTQNTVTISTSVNPQGLHTLYKLDVGTSTAYGSPYPGDAGSGSTAVPLTFHLSGLKAGDGYHFRLVASNSDGSSSEADQTFTTAAKPPEPPVELIKPPSELGLLSFTAKAFPNEPGTTTTKALTNAQKLANALKACHKMKSKSRRAACEKQARKRYAPVKKAKK